jgi:hypothetical protein
VAEGRAGACPSPCQWRRVAARWARSRRRRRSRVDRATPPGQGPGPRISSRGGTDPRACGGGSWPSPAHSISLISTGPGRARAGRFSRGGRDARARRAAGSLRSPQD